MEGLKGQVGELGGAGARLGQGALRGGACGGGCVGTAWGTSAAGASAGQCSSSCSGWSCCCSSAFGCPCFSWVWFGCALGGSACFGFSHSPPGFALKVASSSASDGGCKKAEDAVLTLECWGAVSLGRASGCCKRNWWVSGFPWHPWSPHSSCHPALPLVLILVTQLLLVLDEIECAGTPGCFLHW